MTQEEMMTAYFKRWNERAEHGRMRVGGLFKTELVTTPRGRRYYRAVAGSGGQMCLDERLAAFRAYRMRLHTFEWTCASRQSPKCCAAVFPYLVPQVVELALAYGTHAPLFQCAGGAL